MNLPSSYSSTISELQTRFPLISANQNLLLTLGDNIRVNKECLDYARILNDKKVLDLDTWLYCEQRNLMRDDFLASCRVLRKSEYWDQLRSYMLLLDLVIKDEKKFKKTLDEKIENVFRSLLIEDINLTEMQLKIIDYLPNIMSFEKYALINAKLMVHVIESKPVIQTLLINAVVCHLNENNDSLENVADFIVRLVKHMNESIAATFFNHLESCIKNRFIKDELTNLLFLKLK